MTDLQICLAYSCASVRRAPTATVSASAVVWTLWLNGAEPAPSIGATDVTIKMHGNRGYIRRSCALHMRTIVLPASPMRFTQQRRDRKIL